MGYPMSYRRMVHRNSLVGGYDGSGGQLNQIGGDLRRLEQDQLDAKHISDYATLAGISEQQAETVLRAFFNLAEPGCAACAQPWAMGRCPDHDLWHSHQAMAQAS